MWLSTTTALVRVDTASGHVEKVADVGNGARASAPLVIGACAYAADMAVGIVRYDPSTCAPIGNRSVTFPPGAPVTLELVHGNVIADRATADQVNQIIAARDQFVASDTGDAIPKPIPTLVTRPPTTTSAPIVDPPSGSAPSTTGNAPKSTSSSPGAKSTSTAIGVLPTTSVGRQTTTSGGGSTTRSPATTTTRSPAATTTTVDPGSTTTAGPGTTTTGKPVVTTSTTIATTTTTRPATTTTVPPSTTSTSTTTTTTVPAVPGAPSNLVLTPLSYDNTPGAVPREQVSVTFTPPVVGGAPTGFQLIAQVSTFTDFNDPAITTNVMSFNVARSGDVLTLPVVWGRLVNTGATVTLTASNGAGTSAASAPVSGALRPPVPATPVITAAVWQTHNTLRVTFAQQRTTRGFTTYLYNAAPRSLFSGTNAYVSLQPVCTQGPCVAASSPLVLDFDMTNWVGACVTIIAINGPFERLNGVVSNDSNCFVLAARPA